MSARGDGREGGRDDRGREVGQVAAEEEDEAVALARAGESKSEGDVMAAAKEAGGKRAAAAWAAEEARVGGQWRLGQRKRRVKEKEVGSRMDNV